MDIYGIFIVLYLYFPDGPIHKIFLDDIFPGWNSIRDLEKHEKNMKKFNIMKHSPNITSKISKGPI